jgi:hypothetical protein
MIYILIIVRFSLKPPFSRGLSITMLEDTAGYLDNLLMKQIHQTNGPVIDYPPIAIAWGCLLIIYTHIYIYFSEVDHLSIHIYIYIDYLLITLSLSLYISIHIIYIHIYIYG